MGVPVDPRVHASLSEVPIEGAGVAVLIEQRAEVSEIVGEILGRNSRVLPAFIGVRLARDVSRRPQSRLPDLPDLLLRLGVVVQLLVDEAWGHRLHEARRHRIGLLLRLGGKLGQHPPLALRQHLELFGVDAELLVVIDEYVVEPLQGDRLVLARGDHLRGGGVDVFEPDDHE